MKIIPLNEGIYIVSPQKEFKLFTEENTGQIEAKSLKMAICPFLIVIGDDVILLDTGLSFPEDRQSILFSLIERAGYRPELITKILISHLHKDHIGGIGYIVGTEFVPNFPNAIIYIQEKELNYALEQESNPSFDVGILKYLTQLPNIHLLNEEKGTIGEHVSYEITGGHSPFHQVFWIRENKEIVFYGADNLPQKSYLRFHVAYKTDFDGKKAMELRQKWELQAKDEHWQVLFYHDIEQNNVVF